jgi:hypothetical protein
MFRTAADMDAKSRDKNGHMSRKNAAAVELGRRGGRATAAKLTAQERKESARRASLARWAKQKKEKV